MEGSCVHLLFLVVFGASVFVEGAYQDPRRMYRRSIVQHLASEHLTPKVKRSHGSDNALIRTKRRHNGAHELLTPKVKRSFDTDKLLTRTKRLDIAANDESRNPLTIKKRRDIPRDTHRNAARAKNRVLRENGDLLRKRNAASHQSASAKRSLGMKLEPRYEGLNIKRIRRALRKSQGKQRVRREKRASGVGNPLRRVKRIDYPELLRRKRVRRNLVARL